ncbi:glycosyltransferase [Desulfoluna butyratoxydans]|uniref:Nucleotide-diphospho-sugar transferases n=1 Tax=Desulfoluna butyratoxydans TaxID=231438 RepID=A0A4U8YKN0_9BACT|nr:glycosyltransferase [Desulfoluna butyratoxydans]VFQ44445.1 nucleotide-diphospho-sugar transferases [Desulfoluna butyratoxydans]
MDSQGPSLSVIIPAYNEEDFIGATLGRVFELLDDDLLKEVVVVDNGSTDGTAAIARGVEGVTLVPLAEAVTISRARNIGVASSTAPVLAFLDADVLITDEWVRQLRQELPLLEGGPLVVTGARYDLSEEPSALEEVWFAHLVRRTHRAATYLNGGNIITTRAVFEAVGGFREDLVTGEDVDFCDRARAAGAALHINPGYRTHHEGYPKTVKAFFLRELWHGTGDMQSFAAFTRSKVAVAASVHSALWCLSLLLLVTGRFAGAMVAAVVAVALNVGLTVTKFGFITPRALVPNVFYHGVYLVARSLSFLKR